MDYELFLSAILAVISLIGVIALIPLMIIVIKRQRKLTQNDISILQNTKDLVCYISKLEDDDAIDSTDLNFLFSRLCTIQFAINEKTFKRKFGTPNIEINNTED